MTAETFDQSAEQGPEGAVSDETVDQTFRLGDECRLVVENPRGRIRISGWDRAEVHLRAVKVREGSSPARFQATRIEIRQEDDRLIARTVLDGSAVFRRGGFWDELVSDAMRSVADLLRNTGLPAEVDYDVQVPRRAELELKRLTGEATVEDVNGRVRISSVSGSDSLVRAEGDLHVSTVSGSIAAREVVGNLEARSVSGSIRMSGELALLRAHSVSGSMELAGPLAPGGSYDFHSVSGSVTLKVPDETSATISARGVSLAVTSDLPCEVLRDRRAPGSRHWEGRLNEGAAAVSVQTVSGHLYLARLLVGTRTESANPMPDRETAGVANEATGEGADTSSTAAPAPGATPEGPVAASSSAETAQLRILRALERGELSVDDALRQLDSLRG